MIYSVNGMNKVLRFRMGFFVKNESSFSGVYELDVLFFFNDDFEEIG